MRRIILIGLVLLMGCETSQKVDPKDIAAKVNGEVILKADYEKLLERNLARYRGQGQGLPPGIDVRIKESVLRRMVDDKVIEQKAVALKVAISDEELDEKFDAHKKRFRTKQAFQDYLQRSNNTEENMKADLRRTLLRDLVVEKMAGAAEVTPEEVKKYYEDNKSRFVQREQVRAARILFRVDPKGSSDKKKKLLDKAKTTQAKASKKDADFAVLAKELSNGPEASRGGELGWLSKGRMPPKFDEVAFSLKPGTVSDVVETRLGFEVIKVFEKQEEKQRSYEEVEANIKNSLTARNKNKRRRDVLRDLKTKAQVEQMLKFELPKPVIGKPIVPPPGTPKAKTETALKDTQAPSATE
ncbi:MAG: peptidylprolyl isomerase [Myxococcota bacterium]|nr:peptidylprolyl isomerase [Myxococcota bacterium]